MKEFFISFGLIDKKLIWPFFYALVQIIEDLILKSNLKNKQFPLIVYIENSFGQMSIMFIPKIFGYKNKNAKEKKCSKKNIKYFFLLLLFNLIYYIVLSICARTININTNPHDSTFFTKEGVEIILITLITFLVLKYKYFIHHIICLIIFCLLCIFMDLILNNYEKNLLDKTTIEIIMSIVILILEILNYCYQKYMMEILLYNYWSLSLALGISLFFQQSAYVCLLLLQKNENLIKSFENMEIGYAILCFFVYVIIGFFLYLSRILTLDYYTPNYMLIAYELKIIYLVLTQSENDNKWYSLILFIFLFFILMFYLEIFEFNFCQLNKNTKRNIRSRAKSQDLIEDDSSDRNSIIEIDKGYIIKDRKTNGTENELCLLNNVEEDSDNYDNFNEKKSL